MALPSCISHSICKSSVDVNYDKSQSFSAVGQLLWVAIKFGMQSAHTEDAEHVVNSTSLAILQDHVKVASCSLVYLVIGHPL